MSICVNQNNIQTTIEMMTLPIGKLGYVFKDDIFRSISGEDGKNQVGVRFIEDRQKLLQHRYSTMSYLAKVPQNDLNEIYIKCLKINALEIIQILGGCTSIGTVIGGIIGWFLPAPATTLTGGLVGGACGFGIGAGICYEKKLHLNESYIKIILNDKTDYQKFIAQKDGREYKLLLSFFNEYIQHVPKEYENEMYNFLCCLTLQIPEVPVFSPHDTQRKHPYEKSEIEEVLNGVQQKIATFRENAGTDLCQDEIEEVCVGLLENGCPFRMGGFTKDQLVYDTEHVKKTIKFLQQVVSYMSKNLKCEDDHVLQNSLKLLINHYRQQYTQVTDKVIHELRNDLWNLRADFDTAEKVSNEIKELLNKA